MESPVSVLLVLSAIAAVAALELRQLKMSLVATAVALGLFVVAMFVVGAVEVGVGAVVAAVVVLVVMRWAIGRTEARDTVPAFGEGAGSVLAIATVVAFVIVTLLLLRGYCPVEPVAGTGNEVGSHVGLLREVIVVVSGLAAVWAMLRKTGRRDE